MSTRLTPLSNLTAEELEALTEAFEDQPGEKVQKAERREEKRFKSEKTFEAERKLKEEASKPTL